MAGAPSLTRLPRTAALIKTLARAAGASEFNSDAPDTTHAREVGRRLAEEAGLLPWEAHAVARHVFSQTENCADLAMHAGHGAVEGWRNAAPGVAGRYRGTYQRLLLASLA